MSSGAICLKNKFRHKTQVQPYTQFYNLLIYEIVWTVNSFLSTIDLYDSSFFIDHK